MDHVCHRCRSRSRVSTASLTQYQDPLLEQPDASTTLNPKQVPAGIPKPFALPTNSKPSTLVNWLHVISCNHIVHHSWKTRVKMCILLCSVAGRSYLVKCVESPTIKCLGKETLISTADGIS